MKPYLFALAPFLCLALRAEEPSDEFRMKALGAKYCTRAQNLVSENYWKDKSLANQTPKAIEQERQIYSSLCSSTAGFTGLSSLKLPEAIPINIKVIESSWWELTKILRAYGMHSQATQFEFYATEASKEVQRLTKMVKERRGDLYAAMVTKGYQPRGIASTPPNKHRFSDEELKIWKKLGEYTVYLRPLKINDGKAEMRNPLADSASQVVKSDIRRLIASSGGARAFSMKISSGELKLVCDLIAYLRYLGESIPKSLNPSLKRCTREFTP